MAFAREATVYPVSIGYISVSILAPEPLGSDEVTVRASIQVGMSDNSFRVRKFNLLDHYTIQQINSLGSVDLAEAIRAKAVNEILPESP